MFNVTVAAKFSMHAKIKYMQLYLIDLLSLGLMYVKKINSFCEVPVLKCTQKKIGSVFQPHGVCSTLPVSTEPPTYLDLTNCNTT